MWQPTYLGWQAVFWEWSSEVFYFPNQKINPMNYPKIILKKGKEISLKRRHHWVFSGAIAEQESDLENGALVSVFSRGGEFLGIGHFSNGSIMVRMISFEKSEIDQNFWDEKIQSAFQLRNSLGLTDSSQTNVYRLIHGEGDLLPGFIIDFYNGTAVIQCHQIGMHQHLENISKALQNCYGEKLKAIFDKSSETLPKHFGINENNWVFGSPETDLVQEYGATYRIDWDKGQKNRLFHRSARKQKTFGELFQREESFKYLLLFRWIFSFGSSGGCRRSSFGRYFGQSHRTYRREHQSQS